MRIGRKGITVGDVSLQLILLKNREWTARPPSLPRNTNGNVECLGRVRGLADRLDGVFQRNLQFTFVRHCLHRASGAPCRAAIARATTAHPYPHMPCHALPSIPLLSVLSPTLLIVKIRPLFILFICFIESPCCGVSKGHGNRPSVREWYSFRQCFSLRFAAESERSNELAALVLCINLLFKNTELCRIFPAVR